MKYTTIYLGENKIEIFNSIIGRETIKVNYCHPSKFLKF